MTIVAATSDLYHGLQACTWTAAHPPTDIAGYDPTRDADGYEWNPTAAQHAVDFFHEALVLTSGRSAGKPFLLSKWQADFIGTLFGWKRRDATRRYREALFFVPRKNGKTETGAGIALYTLCCDKEAKPEIYSAAKTREQASRVYEPAQIMVRQSAMLRSRIETIPSQKRLVFAQNSGYYCAISADAKTAHGKNPHAVLFDELHTQPNRDLYDGLKSGMGARTQPLFVSMTTAGYDRHSICYQTWQYACQVRDGIIRDSHFLPMIYQIEEGEDWSSEDVWRKCNPNLGVTVSLDFLREEYARAKESPAYENTFRNLYLNQWTEQSVRWISRDKWQSCVGEVEPMYGEPCYAALDLSITDDITAFAMVFPRGDKMLLKVHYWVPGEAARVRELRDRVPYRQWIEQGHITATHTNGVDYDKVRADIVELGKQYNIQGIAIDRWNAQQISTQLSGDGFLVEPFGQGYASMSSPAKQFERAIIDGLIVHDDNPVTNWMIDNVAIEKDAAGNIKPSKKASTERIDGVVATVMAIGLHAKNLAPTWSTEELGL